MAADTLPAGRSQRAASSNGLSGACRPHPRPASVRPLREQRIHFVRMNVKITNRLSHDLSRDLSRQR